MKENNLLWISYEAFWDKEITLKDGLTIVVT